MKPTFTVRLPKPLIEAIKARASDEGISQGKLLQKLLTPALAPVERAADSPVHPPASPTSLSPEDASPTVEVDRESSDAYFERAKAAEEEDPPVPYRISTPNDGVTNVSEFEARVKELSRTIPRTVAEKVARQEFRRG